jgi:hypothetical protein
MLKLQCFFFAVCTGTQYRYLFFNKFIVKNKLIAFLENDHVSIFFVAVTVIVFYFFCEEFITYVQILSKLKLSDIISKYRDFHYKKIQL